ncbi:hypothetical protein [Culicoidibacter larvae]|uniref:Uncharacterized protein n=1 Tax=Culicoidibacter larvae TaxID=2579976 RepID=A0A5R8QFR7_9FIRM|nr:hypothetical protein [Culicoidibacter larvae]TLG76634.1 hypothetical protein FEZ08_03190 [Culicoidibacter larvae]
MLIFALTMAVLLIIAAYQDWKTLLIDNWLLYSLLFCAATYGAFEQLWGTLLYGGVLFLVLFVVQKSLKTFGEADIFAWVSVFVLIADWRFLLWLGSAILLTMILFWQNVFRKQPAPFFPGMAIAYIFILGGLLIW